MPPMTESKANPPVAAPAEDVPLIEDEVTVVPPASEAHEPAEVDAAAPSAEDVRKAITEAYSATTKWLREQHRAEFVTHQRELLAARGIDWSPSPTKEERAKTAALKVLTDAGLSPSDLT